VLLLQWVMLAMLLLFVRRRAMPSTSPCLGVVSILTNPGTGTRDPVPFALLKLADCHHAKHNYCFAFQAAALADVEHADTFGQCRSWTYTPVQSPGDAAGNSLRTEYLKTTSYVTYSRDCEARHADGLLRRRNSTGSSAAYSIVIFGEVMAADQMGYVPGDVASGSATWKHRSMEPAPAKGHTRLSRSPLPDS